MESELFQNIKQKSDRWLVTGAAGFIGSHLVERLLLLGQEVIGLDNFSTGRESNLQDVEQRVGSSWKNFELQRADIADLEACQAVCSRVDYVLHQAALGSVPRSIADPVATNTANVTGFLNVLLAAKDAKVKRFVYASSSSVYGDLEELPKREGAEGAALSPYAVSKQVNELYARVFEECYDFPSVGLRYFNVFGPRQNPEGPYAAVIPIWIDSLTKGEVATIFGDGNTSRDFCYVENVVQANLLAATVDNSEALGKVYNIAVGDRTSLTDLHGILAEIVSEKSPSAEVKEPCFADFRPGDVPHSHADISLAEKLLGYQPTHRLKQGLQQTVEWFLSAE